MGRVRDYIAWKAERRAKINAEMAMSKSEGEFNLTIEKKHGSRYPALSKIGAALTVALSIFGSSDSSHALALTNRGDDVIRVVIAEAKMKSEIELDLDQEVIGICMAGCIIKLPNGDQQEFEGDEIVEVDEEGFTIIK